MMMPFSLQRLLLLLLLLSVFVFGPGSLLADHIKFHKTEKTPPTSAKNKTDRDIIRYNKKLLSAYNKYQKKAAKIWGAESLKPDPNKDVTYRDDFRQRSEVDYEQGVVSVELAIASDRDNSPKEIGDKLTMAVMQTLLQGPDERSIISIAEDPTPPKSDKPPVLEGLVTMPDGSPVTAQNAEAFTRSQAHLSSMRAIVGTDGHQRIIIGTRFNLLPDHIRIRAKQFSKAIEHYAKVHRLPASLIYAIIETESMFNPYAKSPVPAFGLMQLVPGGGARDAFRFLYDKDHVVRERYLYDPDNNIELGVAYLHILYFRYFRHIKDPVARTWASVAAYNTGAQNVLKAFSGDYNKANYVTHRSWKKHALSQINNMKPEHVYDHLHQYLPYEETRNYIKKIRDRMSKYET